MPLARGSSFRAREEEVALAPQILSPSIAELAEEPRQVPPKIGGGPSPPRDVEALERSVREVRRADATEETVHPFGRDEPVGKAGDRTSAGRRHGRQGGVRGRGKDAEEARQEVPDLEDASESERRGEKRGGLGVPGIGVPVGKRDRVGGKLRARPLPQQTFQRSCDRTRARYGMTLFSGYSTIPEAPSFLRRGIRSRTIFWSTMTSRENQPASLKVEIVGFCIAGRTLRIRSR